MLSSVSTIQGEMSRGFAQQHAIGLKNEAITSSANEAITSSANNEADKTEELSPEEQQDIQQLKARDLEVRTHEQAHLSAAGSIALGGPNFTFVTGPDGNRYAVGGDIQVDVSTVRGDPEATIQKAEIIKRAAMAPASPSMQDQRVAAKASAMANKAQMEILQRNQQIDETESEKNHSVGSVVDISA